MKAGKPRQGRIEPVIGTPERDLRLTLEDRVAAGRMPKPDRSRAAGKPAGRSPFDPIEDIIIDDSDEAAVARGRTKAAKSGKTGRGGRKRGSAVGGLIRGGLYWGAVLGLWGGIAGVGVLGYTFATLPQTDDWVVPQRPPNVEIVDASGRLIANRGDTGGEAVRLEQLPPHLPQAVIAIEDRRFYSHFGVDPIGLVRATVTNFTAGSVVQGGSTLTQQLAKNLFLEPDRTLERKLQEVVLALWLEWRFSKDEILEMYLNRVYLGAGAYGVDGAARRYFGKSAREVTIAEAATLAGLLKAPSRFAPTRDPELAEARARVVLAAMREEGYISEEQRLGAIAAPTRVVSEHNSRAENYVADWVMDLLPGYVASIKGDIIVKTTIDVGMQNAAEEALRQVLAKDGAAYRVSQGALVAIGNGGAVKALVGGRDYGASQFNRAVQARRQPGSAFKPFVYLTAIERGYTPDRIVVDEPISIKGWRPKNYDGGYLGPITLTTALAKSVNTVAARLAAEVGPSRVAQTARRVGIVSRLHENPSIALGTAEVTPMEITAAYVPFANGGFGVIPYVIDSIRTKDGTVLFKRQGDGPGRVISERTVGTMNRMMQTVLDVGTGQKAVLPGRPAGGKTGTSQDFRDAWFIGYVNGLTAGVWLGNDDNSSTKKATGGSLTAVIWNRFMTAAVAGTKVRALPGTDFRPPSTPARPAPGDPLLTSTLTPPVPAAAPSPEERSLLERLFGG